MNTFERHSKKYIILFILLTLAVVVYGVETVLQKEVNKKILSKTVKTRVIRESGIVRYIRLAEHSPSSFHFIVPTDLDMKKADSLIQKEYRFEIDEHGYVYPSLVHEKPDITILFLGGSTTESSFVEEKNRFPYLVGRLLEKGGKKVNSINSGKSGNNSMHSINILLNKGLEHKPDVVIMKHNINDLNKLLYEGDYWKDNPWKSLIITKYPPSHYSISYHINAIVIKIIPQLYRRIAQLIRRAKTGINNKVVDEFAHIRGKKLTIDKEKILPMFESNLHLFITIAKSKSITPVLMTQAHRFIEEAPDKAIIANWSVMKENGITYEAYRDIYLEMNQAIRRVAEMNNVLLIDLEKEVPQTSAYMYDCVHLNDKGSVLAAQFIASKLSSALNINSDEHN